MYMNILILLLYICTYICIDDVLQCCYFISMLIFYFDTCNQLFAALKIKNPDFEYYGFMMCAFS